MNRSRQSQGALRSVSNHQPVSWTRQPLVVPPRRNDVRAFEVDGEATLLDPPMQSRIYLNRTAWYVWNQCDGRRDTEAMALGLAETFDVEADAALDDVEQLVAMFADAGLLQGGGEQ